MRARVRLTGSGPGFVICDARHWPIVVVAWVGPSDLEVIARFGEWLNAMLDYAEANSQRFALISDVTRSEPPSGEARRALVSLREAQLRRSREHMVHDYVVSDRPVMRAAIKALHWIAPQLGSTPIGSLDEALVAVQQELERAGVAAPRLGALEFDGPE